MTGQPGSAEAGYLELLERMTRSHERALGLIDGLTDEQLRGDSRLPGWTRGHVVAHLARNADALNRLAVGAISGEQTPMYPGGPSARAAAIEEGADRPAALSAADFRFAGDRLLRTLRAMPATSLEVPVEWRVFVPARMIPRMRWSELEIHLVDLDVGSTPLDWPEEFVEEILSTERGALADKHPEVAAPELPPAEFLAWLIGRPTRSGLPAVPTWPF